MRIHSQKGQTKMKAISNLLVSVAAAGLAFAPIAAQANTRAGDSSPIYSSAMVSSSMAQDNDGEGMGAGTLIIGVLAVAAIIGAIVIALDSDEPASPGA
jgi:hypothetical protein